ncbi:MAG: hypothetical protein ACI9R3_006483, partial [Verrucomicrobiales bacterium]
DGFQATVLALQMAFGKRLVLMSCILHLIISIRDGAKKKFREHHEEVADWFWWCYEAETKRGFAQRWKSLIPSNWIAGCLHQIDFVSVECRAFSGS